MANDWIKMRVGLCRDPRVIEVARRLAADRSFIQWLCDPVRTSADDATEHVTLDCVTRVTVGSLLTFWGAANEAGETHGDDLILRYADRYTIDEMASLPGLGDALVTVGWAIENESENTLILPRFLLHNVTAEERKKSHNAERQRRFRDRQKSVTESVTNPVTPSVTPALRSNAPSSLLLSVTSSSSEGSARETTNGTATTASLRGLSGAFTMRQIDAIREAYPAARVRGKQAVDRAIDAALHLIAERYADAENPQGSAAGWLLARTRAFAKSPAGNKGDYTPRALTWFSDGGYDDKDAAWQDSKPVTANGAASFDPTPRYDRRKYLREQLEYRRSDHRENLGRETPEAHRKRLAEIDALESELKSLATKAEKEFSQ